MKYLNEKSKKVRSKNFSQLTRKDKLRARYNLFQLYYGSINQFRPAEAKRLYCRLEPKVGILDFSAGWGGRCLAAIAYGVPYIGIDANTNLKKSYEQMINALDASTKVHLLFQPSETVDFSKYKYDLVFTSPPYFMIEEYEKMPQYGSKEGFLDKFFRPVVTNVWKNLQSPGYMALNMPKEMYDSVKDLLPPLHKRLRLPVMSRHPTNAAKRRQIGETEQGARSEGIYVWKK
jgi:16S rRNA G966 N2-methylase RsmD